MLRRFNIYYMGSGIMLFVMLLLMAQTMRERGLSIWSPQLPPAMSWSAGLQGEYDVLPGEAGTLSEELLGQLQINSVDSLKTRLSAMQVLEFDLEPTDMSPVPSMTGLLAVNDFEDRQILVEWYELGLILERQDGCELLFKGDSTAFKGSTLGDLCFPGGGRGQYASLSSWGSTRDFVLKVELFEEGSGRLLQDWAYRLRKEE